MAVAARHNLYVLARRDLRAPRLRRAEARVHRGLWAGGRGLAHHRGLRVLQDLLHDRVEARDAGRAAPQSPGPSRSSRARCASNATTFAQYGALAALREKEKTRASLERMLAAFDRRRRLLHAALSRIPGVSLRPGAGRLLPVPERVELRPELAGFLREAPRRGEGRRRARVRFRRRGLPAHELRDERRDDREGRRPARQASARASRLETGTETRNDPPWPTRTLLHPAAGRSRYRAAD